ncbi:hypothetical protein BN946_scf184985.g30 [Trametes cinnabarina]|uniref:Uncharacterized protein n=1 Tax=Pycnoporus cinnabarinus TaxID=5643 RepID=A0A060SEF8_PYCCI|nr:hypothetical protein BN946_scf184985.g30 [Trametes cinnabarina]
MSTTSDHDSEPVAIPHTGPTAHNPHGHTIHIVIPLSNPLALEVSWIPGHGHPNVRAPLTIMRTPGHGHPNLHCGRHDDVGTPSRRYSELGTAQFEVVSPRDCPSTATQPRQSAQTSHRSSLFSSADDPREERSEDTFSPCFLPAFAEELDDQESTSEHAERPLNRSGSIMGNEGRAPGVERGSPLQVVTVEWTMADPVSL